jgi:hypothetical protein
MPDGYGTDNIAVRGAKSSSFKTKNQGPAGIRRPKNAEKVLATTRWIVTFSVPF